MVPAPLTDDPRDAKFQALTRGGASFFRIVMQVNRYQA